MKYLATISLLLQFVFSTFAADQFLYLSSGDEVTVYRIDPDKGGLDPVQEVALPVAGPMAASPDRKHLYVHTTSESEDRYRNWSAAKVQKTKWNNRKWWRYTSYKEFPKPFGVKFQPV